MFKATVASAHQRALAIPSASPKGSAVPVLCFLGPHPSDTEVPVTFTAQMVTAPTSLRLAGTRPDQEPGLRGDHRPAGPPVPPVPPDVRVGMTELDRASFLGLAVGDVTDVVEQVISRATAIAGTDGDDATNRTLARRIAATEAVLELVDALVSKSVVGRDFDAVVQLERLSKMYATRLIRLVEAHALHGRLSYRASVVIDGNDIGVR